MIKPNVLFDALLRKLAGLLMKFNMSLTRNVKLRRWHEAFLGRPLKVP